MTKQEVRETLEKQLRLLSERSKSVPPMELSALTNEMITITTVLDDHFLNDHSLDD